MRRWLPTVHAAIGLLALAALPAQAQSGQGRAQTALGMGGVLCRDYLRAARSSDMLYHQASQWLLGYVSGMNGALKTVGGTEPPISINSDQALRQLGTYCDANPTSTLANATVQWYAALPKAEPVQAEAKPEAAKSSGSLILNLDNAPARKPLLDRR